MAEQRIKFDAEVSNEEVRGIDPAVKEATQVVTNEELEKLLPIMAGKKITKDEEAWAEELMNRQVTLGSVIQASAMMVAPTKEALLNYIYILLDNQDVFKRTLVDLGATDEMFKKHSEAIVKERDEAREKAQALVKEQLEEEKKATSKAVAHKHHKKH